MRYEWMDGFLLSKRGVTKDLQPEWNWIRYHVGGKMFAALLLDDRDAPYYINLKLDPTEGEFLRGQYPDIIPGYYANKLHWNSIRADGEVPDDLVRSLLEKSYRLVLAGFSRKRQREILGVSACGADCRACPLRGERCPGCTEAKGRVIHAPAGRACPIYACCDGRRRATCAGCGDAPCAIWRDTRDPSMTDGQFEESVRERMERLEGT